jgi:hypothetical protein
MTPPPELTLASAPFTFGRAAARQQNDSVTVEEENADPMELMKSFAESQPAVAD